MFIQFVRDPKTNQRRGIVAGVEDHDRKTVHIGWSYTNIDAGDSFNRDFGLRVAIGRANKLKTVARAPDVVKPIIERVKLRINKALPEYSIEEVETKAD